MCTMTSSNQVTMVPAMREEGTRVTRGTRVT
jgi:hypothetical protein